MAQSVKIHYFCSPISVDPICPQPKVAKLLLDRGAEVNAHVGGFGILDKAAYHGRLQVAKLLLDRGAKVDVRNKWGATPLHNAAMQGDLQVVKLLLDSGAKVHRDFYA